MPEMNRRWDCVDGQHNRAEIESTSEKESIMIGWALAFLVIALIAGVLGFTGIAGAAANIAWILFVVGLILAVVFWAMGRRRPTV